MSDGRKTKKTRLSLLLAKRIKKEFGMEVIPVIHRTYCGRWQRGAGGWSWFMLTKNNVDIGSTYRATEVLKAKKVSLCDGLDILVEDDVR